MGNAWVGQAGIAGAEVVDGQRHAQAGQRTHAPQALVGITDQHGLRELQLQQAGRQVAMQQRGGHAFDELRLLELQRRHVDGDRRAQTLPQPLRRLHHGLPQHPVAERHDETTLFGQGMKSAGAISPRTGSRQRSSASAPMTRRPPTST